MIARRFQQVFALFLMSIAETFAFGSANGRIFVSTPVSNYPKRVVEDYMDRLLLTLTPDMSVDETLQLFLQNDLSAAPVVDREKKLVGIVSSFDFLQKEAFEGSLLAVGGSQEMVEKYVEAAKKICGHKVEEIMSKNPSTAFINTPMRTAAAIMAEKRLHRLPVVNSDGHLVGMLTTSHVIKDLMHVLQKLPSGTDLIES